LRDGFFGATLGWLKANSDADSMAFENHPGFRTSVGHGIRASRNVNEVQSFPPAGLLNKNLVKAK
jgi:hypothetical protein